MVNIYIVIATALCWYGLIEGAGWITVVGMLFAGWQARRYADNKLVVNGRK
jgi:hypothetical protein